MIWFIRRFDLAGIWGMLMFALPATAAIFALVMLVAYTYTAKRRKFHARAKEVFAIADLQQRLAALNTLEATGETGGYKSPDAVYESYRSGIYFALNDETATLQSARDAVAMHEAHSDSDSGYYYCRIIYVQFLLSFRYRELARREYDRLDAEIPKRYRKHHASQFAILHAELALLEEDWAALRAVVAELPPKQKPWATLCRAVLDLQERNPQSAAQRLHKLQESDEVMKNIYLRPWVDEYLEKLNASAL